MNDYERQLFNGKCPYSDLPCDKDIKCLKCSVEEYERRLYEGESKDKERQMGITINISIDTKDYEFYNVPEEVAKAIITLLHECEKDDSKICSAESER